MEILSLNDRPDLLDRVASWQFGEWGFLDPNDSLERRREKLRRHLHEEGLPLTLIAVESPARRAEALGSADLIHYDLPDRPDLTPWLSAVFVPPEHRGRGVGTALTRQAVAEAARAGAPKVYLCTWERESFYQPLGWRTIERFTSHGAVCVIMEIATGAADLRPASGDGA